MLGRPVAYAVAVVVAFSCLSGMGAEVYIPPCERSRHIQRLASYARVNLVLGLLLEDEDVSYAEFKALTRESRNRLFEKYFRGKPLFWQYNSSKNLLVVRDPKLSAYTDLLEQDMKKVRFQLPLSRQCVLPDDTLGFPPDVNVHVEVRPFSIKSVTKTSVKEKGRIEIHITNETYTERTFDIQCDDIRTLDFIEAIMKHLDSAACVYGYWPENNTHYLTFTPLVDSTPQGFDTIEQVLVDPKAFAESQMGGKDIDSTEFIASAMHKYPDRLLGYLADSHYFRDFLNKSPDTFDSVYEVWWALFKTRNRKVHDFMWRAFPDIDNLRFRKMIMVDGTIPDAKAYDGAYTENWQEFKTQHPELHTLYEENRKTE